MVCVICRNLEQVYEASLSEYLGRKNVDMERARYELEEHRLVCASVVRVRGHLPERVAPVNAGQLAA
jgi:hypothetical protein